MASASEARRGTLCEALWGRPCDGWYDYLVEDYEHPHKPDYWWAGSPTGKVLAAKIKSLIYGRAWDQTKKRTGTVLPCFCVALLNAVQLCVPEDESYFYDFCSNEVKDRMDRCFYEEQKDRLASIVGDGTEELMDEPDGDEGNVYVESFVREEARERLEVHFTEIDSDKPSLSMKSAAVHGLIDPSKPTFCLTISLPGLFGIEVFVKQDDRNMVRGLVPKPNTTSSDASFEHALAWIAECDNNHTCLTSKSPSGVMPRRVIDIGHSPGNEVRLHVLNGNIVVYMTLSHCWGSNQHAAPLKTTKDTLDEHLVGISISSLSKTFQDAIAFTRRLGIRYLWIDSLCIVQDDDLDWQSEIPKMGDIYQNSWLTLAAVKSSDGSGGLFCDTRGRPIRFFQNGEEVSFHFRRVYSDKASYPNMDEHLDINMDRSLYDEDFPLLFRGWVTQERLLSPRTLFFCASEIIWECSEKAQCECWGREWGSTKDPFISGFLEEPYDDSKYPDYFDWWLDFAQSYSSTQFSHPTDKIPALFGIIAFLIDKLYHPPLGPLPSERVDSRLDYLLWEREEVKPAYKEWVAPSWSWASADGRIAFRGDLHSSNTDAKLIGFDWNSEDVDASTPKAQRLRDVLGKVRAQIDRDGKLHHFIPEFMYSSRVIIEGTLLPVRDGQPDDPYYTASANEYPHQPQSSGEPIKLDHLFWDECKFQITVSRDRRRTEPPVQKIALWSIRLNYGHESTELSCLHLGNRYDGKQYFLLLETVDKDAGIYRRIGMGTRENIDKEAAIPRSWVEQFKTTVILI